MIDLDNLRTASLYINNQLLSRGLLHDGESVNFARPGDDDVRLGETMGRVINIINDLILRRDRDAEHRESLSTSLRGLRAESLRQTNDIALLREKHAESQRKAAIAEAEAASLRSQLRSAEAAVQKLKDDAARMKAMAAQTRAACANEVRKRDRQIDGLKKAVGDAGRARGTARSGGIVSISVTGEVGGDDNTRGGSVFPPPPSSSSTRERQGYDLRMETNSFLAELAKGLSEENETLAGLVRRTTDSLKEMSGWERDEGGGGRDGHATALAVNPEEMAGEIRAILEHLRTILTNPSFVPIEEVVMREDEIHRLRDGWERMETRWSEAVHLMDGWRRRMQADGRPVNVEELKMGLRLSPVRVRDVAETTQSAGRMLAVVEEEGEGTSRLQMPSPGDPSHLAPPPEYDGAGADDDSDAESSIFEDDLHVNELDFEEPNVQVLQQSVMLDSSPLPPPPQLSPLKDSYSAGNRGEVEPVHPKRRTRERPGEFTTIVEEDTSQLRQQETQAPEPPPHLIKPQSPRKSTSRQTRSTRKEDSPSTSVNGPDAKPSVDSVKLVRPEETSEPKPSSSGPTSTTRQRAATTTRTTRQERAERAEASTRPPSSRPATSRPTTTRATRTTRSARQPQEEQQPTPHVSRPASKTESHKTMAEDPSPSQPPASSKSAPHRTTSATSTVSATSTTSATSAISATSTATTTSNASSHQTITSRSNSDNHNPNASPTKLPPVPPSSSRLPLPRTGGNNLLPPPVQSPLTMTTINAKLAASEREADAARVRAKLKAAKLARAGKRSALVQAVVTGAEGEVEQAMDRDQQQQQQQRADFSGKTIRTVDDPRSHGDDGEASKGGAEGGGGGERSEERTTVSSPRRRREQRQEPGRARDGAGRGDGDEDGGVDADVDVVVERPRKRERRTSKAASRRRSTLNPWELKSLIQGDAGGVDAA